MVTNCSELDPPPQKMEPSEIMRSAFSHCGLVCAASLCRAPDVTELHNPNVQKGAFQTAVIGGVKDLYGVVSIKSLFVQE